MTLLGRNEKVVFTISSTHAETIMVYSISFSTFYVDGYMQVSVSIPTVQLVVSRGFIVTSSTMHNEHSGADSL